MGVFVSLKISPKEISKADWEATYLESLQLIERYPFIGFDVKTIKKRTRYLYSHRIERKRMSREERHWHINGDSVSKQTGESFTLYYDLSHYYRSGRKPSIDILEDSGITVFHSKTQGRPFHIPMLGIAMLFETRLSPYAKVSGDIDRHQAINAKDWADPFIEEPLQLPIVTQAQELYRRSSQLYEGAELIDFLQRTFRGPWAEMLQVIVANEPFEQIKSWFLNQIKEYSNPAHRFVSMCSIDWLSATDNLLDLVQMVCLDDGGNRFDPLEYIKSLASLQLFTPLEDRLNLDFFKPSPGIPQTIESMIGYSLFQLATPCHYHDYYCPLEKGITILTSLLPEQAKEIEKILRVEQSESERIAKDKYQQDIETIEKKFSDPSLLPPTVEDLLYYETEKTRDNVQELVKVWSFGVSKMIHNFEEFQTKLEKELEDPISAQDLILIGADENRVTLTDSAWDWIDSLKDEETIKLVAALLMISDNGKEFCDFRVAALENPSLISKIQEYMSNQEIMDDVHKKVEKIKQS